MAASRAGVVSSFTVTKGAQIEATYEVFQRWALDRSRKENLDRLLRADAVGGGTESWRRDLAKTLNRRFETEGRDRILIELAKAGCPLAVWKPILLWHMTRDEFLVRDFLSGWLYEQRASGAWRLRAADVEPYLRQLPARPDVVVKESWSENTTERVASGLLGLASDFDLLAGSVTREFVSYHLPDEALLYLLHAAATLQPNAHRLVQVPDWRMYMLSPDDLQRELYRLHQFRRLRYEVAGSIAELRLPYEDAVVYAHAELIP